MARKKIADATSLELTNDDAELLADIKAATARKGYGFYSPTGLENLVNNELIEINYDIKNPKNGKQFAVRTTDKGNNFTMAKKNVIEATESVGTFAVGKFDRSAVKAKAKTGRRGRESKYHLDRLNEGEFIFVPVNEKHADSDAVAKSLAGTVQAANKKFAVETGEMKTIARKAKGGTEKIEKVIPVLSYTRKYAVYGYSMNGVDGAAIVREM